MVAKPSAVLDVFSPSPYSRALIMNIRLRYVLPLALILLFSIVRSPAPIIYREGQGIVPSEELDIEIKKNAEDQYNLAQRYEDRGDWARAGASYRLVVRRFPRADIAPTALYSSGRMYEKQGKLTLAFNEYQTLVQKYPRSADFEQALQAEYQIAKAYLDGRRVELYGIPTLPSMTKAQDMFKQIVTNAPYSRVAPLAQFGIGQSLEKQGSITSTVNAYQQVVDRYPTSDVAADAMYQIGYVYFVASRETGYDQTAAIRAQEAFEDFLVRYPKSDKVAQAQDNLKILQNRKSTDSFNIARFYDKQKNYKAAYVYYNAVLQDQPNSPEAERAKTRMDQIRNKVGEEKLQIGGGETADANQVANNQQKQVQAPTNTSSRPDYVGPPAPTPKPSPIAQSSPASSQTRKKQALTPPDDVAPTVPNAPNAPSPTPVEPALPSQ